MEAQDADPQAFVLGQFTVTATFADDGLTSGQSIWVEAHARILPGRLWIDVPRFLVMSAPFEDPRWPRASAWLAQGREGGLAVLGAPLNASITPGRCDLAPDAVRAGLEKVSPWSPDAPGLADMAVKDWGDLDVGSSPEEALDLLGTALARALAVSRGVVILGGDNGVTRPGVHGLGTPLALAGLLTLDAHFDLRDTTFGLHNGNPVRALLADGLPGRNVVQIGIQPFANSAAYAEVARDAGIHWVAAGEARRRGVAPTVHAALSVLAQRCDAIYVNLDLDCMDRAFVPGCPGARPGGFTPAEVREAARVCGRHAKVRALDIVEMDPEKDAHNLTALTAALCLLEFAAGLTERHQ